jgi:hypothetical protein
MKIAGIIKQLQSGKYIIELTSGWQLLRGTVKFTLNKTTTITSQVFNLEGKNIMFLTHRLIREMGLLLEESVELQLIKQDQTGVGLKTRMPLTVMY